MPIFIPESELQIEFTGASGPGGQNVNKVSTKAQLRFVVGASLTLSELEKERVREKLKNILTKNDEIILTDQTNRLQSANREAVVAKFQQLIQDALFVPKARRPTRPTRASKERRLEAKRQTSSVKQARRATKDHF